MRVLSLVLLALLALVHAQLWLLDGGGTARQVSSLQTQLVAQRAANEEARQRNERIASEVRDLKEGLEMVEEQARAELGMLKPDEILVQVSAPARP